jgi:ferredoxin
MMPARRAFLGRLLGDLPSDAQPQLPRIPAERIALLKEIALRWEYRLPQGAIPRLRATERCAGHGICASVCPTGALRAFEAEAFQGLEFDAADCFACGACVVVCPEGALRLDAGTPGEAPAGRERITRHALRTCARCDDEFAARGEDELCPACRKDVELFTHGFSARSDGP